MARRLIPGLALPLAGCAGSPSMLSPRGPNAAEIAEVWWVMFWSAVLILAVVTTLALLAVHHRHRARPPPANALIAGGGLAFPVIALTALLVYGFTIRTAPPADDDALVIEVTGHRWWWEVRYPGEAVVMTANELHVPVGRPVRLVLRTADVIHSFWVPQLGGKQDMIPGHTKTLTLQADTAGAYRGQCAEFCGLQHAHMAFWVYALPMGDFEAWRAARARPAKTPTDPVAERGRDRFLAMQCGKCHAIRGTAARGGTGPDLTHVGSRRFMGAGTLRNENGALARLIAGHREFKPGSGTERIEPVAPLDAEAIAAYLEQLQ